MRVNIYAEELTDRIEIISKIIEGNEYKAVRFYLELPVTIPVLDKEGTHLGYNQYQGPFLHQPNDDDSSAVTFWGKSQLYPLLKKAVSLLEEHYKSIGQEWRISL